MKTIPVELPFELISGTTKDSRYEFEPICHGVRYYPIKKLAEIICRCPRQIDRYLKEINEKEMYRYLLYIGGIRYISPGVFILSKQYRNDLNNLEYAKWLSTFTWTHAICITVENMKMRKARNHMENFWSYLQKLYPGKRLILFFTTEKFQHSNDYHIHAILSVESKTQSDKPVILAKAFFKKIVGANIYEKKFDHSKDYVSYTVKYLHKEVDGHDLFKQNL